MTNSAFPFSWPGTNEVSTSGAPQQVASAIVPGPALPDHDVRAAEPVGHVADEALGGQPPVPGPLGQAAEPPPQRAVAAADDDDVDVRHLAQDRGGAAAQPSGPFGPAGEHDQELAAEPEFALELAALLLVERRPAELGRDRQPERHVPVRPASRPLRTRSATTSDGTTTRSTAASTQDRCAVTRSVTTVTTGAPVSAARRAWTAGSAVIGWNATISAGRQASTARSTLP